MIKSKVQNFRPTTRKAIWLLASGRVVLADWSHASVSAECGPLENSNLKELNDDLKNDFEFPNRKFGFDTKSFELSSPIIGDLPF